MLLNDQPTYINEFINQEYVQLSPSKEAVREVANLASKSIFKLYLFCEHINKNVYSCLYNFLWIQFFT